MAQAKKLPARPNLSYLKKLAKQRLAQRKRSRAAPKLAQIQLAIAREYGFASWRKLKAHVESVARQPAAIDPISNEDIERFLDLAVPKPTEDHRGGSLKPALEMLQRHPALTDANVFTAAVVGNFRRRGQLLRDNPSLANALGGIRNWPPLCYLTFSRFLRIEKKKRSRDFVRAAKVLLDAGADPNSFYLCDPNAAKPERETALYGACGVANDAALTRLLLERGAEAANPPDHESLYHATEFSDHECLKLLLDRLPNGSWINYCMCHMLDREDPEGLRLFLDHGSDANFLIDGGLFRGFRPLHFAINRHRSASIIGMLLRAGADPNLPDADGITPYELACRLGHAPAARALRKDGARTELSRVQEAIAAIMSGDSKRLRAVSPDTALFVRSLSSQDQLLLPHAAGAGNLRAVRLMLDLGFDPEISGPWGPALHEAAWSGHLEVVKLLLRRGARLDSHNCYGGDALGAAIHGATHGGHRNGPRIVMAIASVMKVPDFSEYIKEAESDGAHHVARLLLSMGAKPRKTAWKPLMDACLGGDSERVESLLASGSDPNVLSPAPHLYRPLHRTIEHKKTMPKHAGHDRVVELMLRNGADPKLRATRLQVTALQLAATNEIRFIALLRSFFEPLDIFHAALLADDRRVQELLLEDRSLATARDADGFTALICCAASAMYRLGTRESDALVRMARMLLDASADPNAAFLYDNRWPIPVLYFACGQQNNPELTELLLKAGANPIDGESIYHASDENHAECLALLEKHVDPKDLADECTRCLNTQLHWGRVRGMPWLLAHGADPNWINPERKTTAIQEARKSGRNKTVIELLKRAR